MTDQDKEMDGMLDLNVPKGDDEVKVEDKPKEEVVDVEDKLEDEVKPVEVKPDAPAVDNAKIQEDNQRLREQLNELARMTGQKVPEEKPAAEVKPKEEIKEDLIQFMTDEEAEELLDNPKKLNEFLNRVFQAGRERTMKEMPTLVRQQTLTELNLQQLTQKFWGDNNDLTQYKDFVGMVANQIEVTNPSWDYAKVFDETAKVARERLNLPAPGEVKPKEEKKEEEVVDLKPALPVKRGARTLVDDPARTPQQKEIDDLFKFAEGK